nr:cytosolic carboxypeptidase 6-like [Lytechinus pictus]
MADKRVDSGSDSDGDEAVVGNLNKFAVLPLGYSGRPKPGHLIFDACFECGNLGRVDYITEHEYDLFVRPDTCNPRFRVWFNFTVENTKADQRVIFNIVNFSKTKSLYREGMAPMVKSSSRTRWQRIPSKNVYYYRCPDHRKNYVMSFAFCFDKESDLYQFSYCYPYSYTRLQTYLSAIEKRRLDFVKRELLCLSVVRTHLSFPSYENLDPDVKQRVVVITARVHPGETPASYVCQGVLDFLLSQHPIAKVLRDHIVFKVVPMLNPDGVYLGNYRCSLMGFDLNRHWHEPSPWAHPTLHATKQLLVDMNANPNIEVDFYVDIHAHSTLMNGFMYGNVYDDPVRYEKQAIFPKLMCSNADDFSMMNTSFNRDSVKAGTGRRFLGGILDENSLCYTLEVSFFCYTPSSSSTVVPYDDDSYMKLGRNLVKTFLDYYKLSSLITPKPAANISTVNQFRRREKSAKGSKGEMARNERRANSEMSKYSMRNNNDSHSASTVNGSPTVQLKFHHRETKR